ncbi:Extracellular serine proteinase [Streptomyces xanthophaeus]|uniref:S8 family peptidase n=1 Tax=Streptomyces xanthophaeus TaxID=67385 RepID=UPI00233E87A9|nr:S8 family peptidase [Streptomyces xanthophaeus]WCD87821.1 Extracellular serine proteinase [Streptomyces xanthophaeus]
MRLLAPLAAAGLLALTSVAAGSASAAAPEPTPAPLKTAANAVPGQYIVTLEKGVDAAKAAQKLGLKPKFVYGSALNGFAVPLTPLQLTIVRNSLGVKAVEEDAKVQSVPQPSTAPGTRAPSNSWGLDRIDQKELPLDDNFTPEGNGAGVTAYILDTGIDYAHTEFGGPDASRATFGFDAIGDGRNGQDCQGHGTHVAGTVAGKTYGVASKAKLVSVRVLGCDGKGEWSGIIAGLDWVAKNAKQPAVLNVSLGGERSASVNEAADAVTNAGVLPIVAAGNSSVDACNVSPASAGLVLSVGATNKYDEETDFSNYGRCLTLYAPGQAIVSAKLGGGSVALDGTSMAAPHVTGVAVLYKAKNPDATPEDVNFFLESETTKDVLSKLSPASPNKLLYLAGL